MNKRSFLLSVAALGASGAAQAFRVDEGSRFFNPCGTLSNSLRNHEFTLAGFDALNFDDVWDCHAHLLGLGESGGGAWVTPKMQSMWNLRLYAQYRFYLNAACVDASKNNVDRDYLLRLNALLAEFPAGYRALVMAFDRTYDELGKLQLERSAFYLPNHYARKISANHDKRIGWIASVHPYREDASQEVDTVVKQGALAVKWLPPAMGIDPASKLCDRFYDAMVKHDLPLITHGGEERAVQGAHEPAFGNVLKLRRPLERGVRVIVAHCASLGSDIDLDVGTSGAEVSCFELFERLMATREFEGRLFGDVSALPQTNRFTFLERVLKHTEWAGRLLSGSDYPLPGVFPLFSVNALVERNWLKADVGEHLKRIREGNPLLFDFLIKRHLQIDGLKFGRETFETARVFRRAA